MTRVASILAIALVTLFMPAYEAMPIEAAQPSTLRVSVSSLDEQANAHALQPSISSTGRFVAFYSTASTLVSDDTNGVGDVFVRDRDADVDGVFDETGAGSVTTQRVSISSSGAQANGDSGNDGLDISADGHFVAFSSRATNLDSRDADGFRDVYIHDRLSLTTQLISVSLAGTGGGGLLPDVNADGRYVAFESPLDLLVQGDTNSAPDVVVWDRATEAITRASVNTAGVQGNGQSQAPAISPNGRFIAFDSLANNFAPDVNGPYVGDVFLHDRDSDLDGTYDEPGAISTTQVSVHSNGTQGNSGSGRASFSGNGQFVSFVSSSWNLVDDDTNICSGGTEPGSCTDVFVHHLLSGSTERVSVGDSQAQADGPSYAKSEMSIDGRYVVFSSDATNLTPNDTNGVRDVFVRDRLSNRTQRVSLRFNGSQANQASDTGVIDADGQAVVFVSLDSGLIPAGDTNSAADVFAREYCLDDECVRGLPPNSILSPLIGPVQLRADPAADCSGLPRWCFNQHPDVGLHTFDGGICRSDDRRAWDTHPFPPLDEQVDVYAVAQGVVRAYAGSSCNSSGHGAILIEHGYGRNRWWSGYLHMLDIPPALTPGSPVDARTFLGHVSNVPHEIDDPMGVDYPRHLHFVVYGGLNAVDGLVSTDATITPDLGQSPITAPAYAGASVLEVADTSIYGLADTIRINPGGTNEEDKAIAGFGSLLLESPLAFDHWLGEPVIRISSTDIDLDGVTNNNDNCPSDANPLQENDDSGRLGVGAPLPDRTNPHADTPGNACDADDDDDGRSDAAETGDGTCPGLSYTPLLACHVGGMMINPIIRDTADTDGDSVTEGAEYLQGSNPLSAASRTCMLGVPCTADTDGDGVPDAIETTTGSNPAVADSDADGLSDKIEIMHRATSPTMVDTDSGGCDDRREVFSLDGNNSVGFADLLQFAQAYNANGPALGGPSAGWDANKDFSGNNRVDFADLLLFAKAYNLQCLAGVDLAL